MQADRNTEILSQTVWDKRSVPLLVGQRGTSAANRMARPLRRWLSQMPWDKQQKSLLGVLSHVSNTLGLGQWDTGRPDNRNGRV